MGVTKGRAGRSTQTSPHNHTPQHTGLANQRPRYRTRKTSTDTSPVQQRASENHHKTAARPRADQPQLQTTCQGAQTTKRRQTVPTPHHAHVFRHKHGCHRRTHHLGLHRHRRSSATADKCRVTRTLQVRHVSRQSKTNDGSADGAEYTKDLIKHTPAVQQRPQLPPRQIAVHRSRPIKHTLSSRQRGRIEVSHVGSH